MFKLTVGRPILSKLMLSTEQSLLRLGSMSGLQPPFWILDVLKVTHSPHLGQGGVMQSTLVFSRHTQSAFRSLKQFEGPQSTWLHSYCPLMQVHWLQLVLHFSFSLYVLFKCVQPWLSSALFVSFIGLSVYNKKMVLHL